MFQPTICWKNNTVQLIDQTLLPQTYKVITCRDVKTLWHAIKRLSVRGAPALGVAAGFGVLLGMKTYKGKDRKAFEHHVQKISDYIATSRPTAVNLFNVLAEMKQVFKDHPNASVLELKSLLKNKALAVYEQDRTVCRTMGDHGAKLIKNGFNIMTICNAGALATVDYGTAEGVMYSAKRNKTRFHVYACETRPLLQGARLTTWELMRAKVPVTLICDSMAATLMQQGKVNAVFTGADRVASNGDSANKIGTYNLAVLARYHKVPFYIVAPFSTFDMQIKSGKQIPIEERAPEEVSCFRATPTAPRNVKVYNPAFDVTPSRLIKGIVTEAGVIRPPFGKNIGRIYRNLHKLL